MPFRAKSFLPLWLFVILVFSFLRLAEVDEEDGPRWFFVSMRDFVDALYIFVCGLGAVENGLDAVIYLGKNQFYP